MSEKQHPRDEEKATGSRPIRIFYSYAYGDEDFRDTLLKHLGPLESQGEIAGWHEGKMRAGDDIKSTVQKHFESVELILLLISADYLSTKGEEMQRAMARLAEGTARVIPIILRHCNWEGTIFGKLRPLPKGARPIRSWKDEDEAWLDVVRGVQRVVQELNAATRVATDATPPAPKPEKIGPPVEWDFQSKWRLVDALLACECLSTQDSRNLIISHLPGDISYRIQRHPNIRQDVMSIVAACLQYLDGLKQFLVIVGGFERDSIPWRKLQAVLLEIAPGLAQE